MMERDPSSGHHERHLRMLWGVQGRYSPVLSADLGPVVPKVHKDGCEAERDSVGR